MVRTRSQPKIGFPQRKMNIANKSREKVLDAETSPISRPSPAKKSRKNHEGSSVEGQTRRAAEKIQITNTPPARRKTRRTSCCKENEEMTQLPTSPATKRTKQKSVVNETTSNAGMKTPAKLPRKKILGQIAVKSCASFTSSKAGSSLMNRPDMFAASPAGKQRYSRGGHEDTSLDSGIANLAHKQQMLHLGRQEVQGYKDAKHALHSSIPSNLLCRETETKQIEMFLKAHLSHRKSGSLYISGAPGTGKTACLTNILENLQRKGAKCQVQFINSMNLSRSYDIFSKIAQELAGEDKLTNKEAEKFLEKKFTSKGPPVVLVLDEIDQLESKNQDILYTMFEWPSLPTSRLILIGIANALDLTDRVLPRLQLKPECKPKLLHFSPYSKDQIVKILTARLSEVEGANIIEESAVQFCARKITAVSGDMRKALDICRRAVEVVESEVRRQQILKPIDLAASPKKAVMKKVTISHISKVISEVYGSRIVNSCGGEQPTIPLQQKLVICTILLMQKQTKRREIPFGQLHETYCGVCKKRQFSQISQEDCLSLCALLETKGIISMRGSKEIRMTKVALKIDEREVNHALQDKILLASILQEGLTL